MLRRVVGASMLPSLRPGQIIYVRRWRYVPKVNDIIMVKHCGLEKVKIITAVESDGVYVVGDNTDASTDSRHFGVVPFAMVIGKVFKLR
jgi:nickel-type superoxide dismutase maturation protease